MSPDAKAVVRAAEALTTQVRRIADALSTPVVRYEVAADDTPTTTLLHSISTHSVQGFCPACGHGVLMLGDGGHVVCTLIDCPDPDAVDRLLTRTDDGAQYRLDQERNAAALHRQGLISDHELNAVFATTDEDARRTTRRDSLRNLLDRLDRSTVHHYDEAQLLRQHAEAEIREADTARAVAAGNKRHVQVMYEELEREQAASKGLAGKIKEQRSALDLVRTELTAAQAAIERVRNYLAELELAGWSQSAIARRIHAALDGIAQPTTEEPSYAQLRAAYDESWQLIAMQKDMLGTLRRIVMTATTDREDEGIRAERCERCGRDHMAELYDAIVAADERYAEAFAATADGPARPGRLPDQPNTTEPN